MYHKKIITDKKMLCPVQDFALSAWRNQFRQASEVSLGVRFHPKYQQFHRWNPKRTNKKKNFFSDKKMNPVHVSRTAFMIFSAIEIILYRTIFFVYDVISLDKWVLHSYNFLLTLSTIVCIVIFFIVKFILPPIFMHI